MTLSLPESNNLITRSRVALRDRETFDVVWRGLRFEGLAKPTSHAIRQESPNAAQPRASPFDDARKKPNARTSPSGRRALICGSAGFATGLSTSGGWTRTSDLRVMSPTSYQLLYPAIRLVKLDQPAGSVKAAKRHAPRIRCGDRRETNCSEIYQACPVADVVFTATSPSMLSERCQPCQPSGAFCADSGDESEWLGSRVQALSLLNRSSFPCR